MARQEALHSAPLHNKEAPHILDLGCGTGIWGIDMAEYAVLHDTVVPVLVSFSLR